MGIPVYIAFNRSNLCSMYSVYQIPIPEATPLTPNLTRYATSMDGLTAKLDALLAERKYRRRDMRITL
jgi:hypothetical protein